MRTLFAGIPLDQMSVSMTMNGAVLPMLALYIVAAKSRACRRQSSPARSRTTSSKNSWCGTPTSIRPSPSMRIIGGHLRVHVAEDAEVQLHLASPAITCRRRARRQDLELAYTLADGLEYLRAPASGWSRRRQVRAAALVLLGASA
jgi:methylmalonyl-CoA mutase